MKSSRFAFLLILLYLGQTARVDSARWTPEQAYRWYNNQPWFFGGNFLPSTAVNTIDMWQTFDVLTMDRELRWASQINMNIMRVFLHFLFYQQNPQAYYQKIDAFLTIADQYNIKILFVLFDECWLPNPKLGPQPDPIPGVHNSQWVRCPGQAMVADNTTWPLLKQYAHDILTRFSNDARVAIWDLYNEPEASQQLSLVLPLVKEIYATAVSANPRQPLTFGIASDLQTSPLAQFEGISSDVISFHHYGPLSDTMRFVTALRQFNRPLICTEYMARTIGSTFHTHTYYFHAQRIGAINWGLVAGKTQTYFPWGSPVNASIPLVWFHDIFNSTGQPYSPYEIQFFKDLKRPTSAVSRAMNMLSRMATNFAQFFSRRSQA